MLYVPVDKVIKALDIIIAKIETDCCGGVDAVSLCDALRKLQAVITDYALKDMEFFDEIFRH